MDCTDQAYFQEIKATDQQYAADKINVINIQLQIDDVLFSRGLPLTNKPIRPQRTHLPSLTNVNQLVVCDQIIPVSQ